MEAKLLAFNDSTSNQIVVIVTPGFGGRDISSFAFEVGDLWGVGHKGIDNGVVIVVKPKDKTDGQVEIAPGKGLEGVLPDIFCKRIIEREMIPHFRDNDYYEGISAALDIILPACAGEYSFSQYKKDNNISSLITLLIVLGIIGLVIWLVIKIDKNGHNGNIGGSGGTFYGGNTRMGNWGGWSGGSTGSFGGFGGFGGGSFGGGGASGRW